MNNAGIAGKAGLLHEAGPENWRRVMGINLDGVAYAMMTEIEEMLKVGGGSIVNIGDRRGIACDRSAAEDGSQATLLFREE